MYIRTDESENNLGEFVFLMSIFLYGTCTNEVEIKYVKNNEDKINSLKSFLDKRTGLLT